MDSEPSTLDDAMMQGAAALLAAHVKGGNSTRVRQTLSSSKRTRESAPQKLQRHGDCSSGDRSSTDVDDVWLAEGGLPSRGLIKAAWQVDEGIPAVQQHVPPHDHGALAGRQRMAEMRQQNDALVRVLERERQRADKAVVQVRVSRITGVPGGFRGRCAARPDMRFLASAHKRVRPMTVF
jgi:hypothetical protein